MDFCVQGFTCKNALYILQFHGHNDKCPLQPLVLPRQKSHCCLKMSLDMPLHMQGKMVRPGKAPVTVVAFKWLCPCVFPVVPCKFITPGETPITPFPRAFIWLFTCMRSLVCLQMWALCVDFPATIKLASMNSFLIFRGGFSCVPSLLTVT